MNNEAIKLLDEWLADESGYDESTWPELRKRLMPTLSDNMESYESQIRTQLDRLESLGRAFGRIGNKSVSEELGSAIFTIDYILKAIRKDCIEQPVMVVTEEIIRDAQAIKALGGSQCQMEANSLANAVIAASVVRKKCECLSCLRKRSERIGGLPVEMCRMVLCQKCGNKRCPHATDHRHECTGSNAAGQPGSAYAPQL